MKAQWKRRYTGTLTLQLPGFRLAWIEYRPNLQAFDVITLKRFGWKELPDRVLRTNDLFAAISRAFATERGLPQPKKGTP